LGSVVKGSQGSRYKAAKALAVKDGREKTLKGRTEEKRVRRILTRKGFGRTRDISRLHGMGKTVKREGTKWKNSGSENQLPG